MNLNNIYRLTTCAFLISTISINQAQAAKVLQLKGGKVLIDLEGDPVSVNDEFFLINPSTTKKSAIISIKQVKNGKAMAEVTKGTGAVGHTLQAKAAAARPMSAELKEDASGRSSSAGAALKNVRPSWGFVGEYVMATMSASFTRTTPTAHTATSDMKGTGFGAGLFYNHAFSPSFTLAAEGSLQQFNASGSTTLADCNNSTTCDVNIMYLSMYGIGRYYLTPASNLKSWVGGGAGFLLALSKSSSVLNTSQISTNQVFSFAGGADYHLNRKAFVPFSLQYDMFPASDSVKATSMSIRVGYGWNL